MGKSIILISPIVVWRVTIGVPLSGSANWGRYPCSHPVSSGSAAGGSDSPGAAVCDSACDEAAAAEEEEDAPQPARSRVLDSRSAVNLFILIEFQSVLCLKSPEPHYRRSGLFLIVPRFDEKMVSILFRNRKCRSTLREAPASLYSSGRGRRFPEIESMVRRSTTVCSTIASGNVNSSSPA